MGPLDYNWQRRGCPCELGLLRSPPPPSPNSFPRPLAREKKPSKPCSPKSEDETGPFTSRTSPGIQKGQAARAPPAVPARHLSPGESPAGPPRCCGPERLCVAAASWHGLRRGAPLESEKITPGRRIPEQPKREKRRRVLLLFAVPASVRTDIPSTMSGVSPAAALAGIHADQLFDIF